MEMTEKQRAIVVELAKNAWASGAIRSPQMAAAVQEIVALMREGEKPKESKEAA